MTWLLVCSIALALPEAAIATPVHVSGLPPGSPVRLLPTPRGVLLGSDRGLYRREDAGWALVMGRGGVRDLARGTRETWIAAGAGLFVWPDHSAVPVPVGLGAGARVGSVAVDGEGRVFAGTEVGLFAREPGARTFRRDHALPAGTVAGVRAAGGSVWAATRGRLWVREAGGRFEPRLRRLAEGWWELRGAAETADEVWLAVPRGLWRVGPAGPRALELPLGELRALLITGEVAWVASERGLFGLTLASTAAPAVPELGGDAFDLALDGDRLLVALERGLLAVPLARAATPLIAEPGGSDLPALELPVLHRAVLAYQGLGPSRINGVEERARRAALLPEVRMAFALGREREQDRDLDQVFTSGALRELSDHSRGRDTELALSVQLTWDLAEHRDPARAIAVSRERRELVELRDQVLERVNGLYFEWLRVRSRLRARPPESERSELSIRARELAAHLDAWTGGLFSRLARSSPPKPRSLE